MTRTSRWVIGLCWVVGAACDVCMAQVAVPDASPSAATRSLAEQQQGVAERYGRLEALLLRSSEIVAAENPTRAALLRQAVQLSKQYRLTESLTEAAANLGSQQYSEAIVQQKAAKLHLEKVLELLQSENREKRVREQRDQVRRWIEETDRLLRLQSSLRGRTEGGQEFESAAENQLQLAEKANEISRDLGQDSPSSPPPTDDENSQEDASDASEPKADPPPQDPKNDPVKPEDAERDKADDPGPSDASDERASDPGETQDPSGNNPPSESPSSESPSSEGPAPENASDPQQPTPGGQAGGSEQPAEPQNPTERAKQKIEQAQQRMREAQQALDDAERDGAVAKQREAEENLREAVAELEQILRQLREEEIERSLASLETRLRRMLEMQGKVLDETKRLGQISGEQQSRQVEFMASKLSLEEKKIFADGERAYLLLKEEGSSAAFPEAIEQVNLDISDIVVRLSEGDVGELTVIIEQEIVNALEEMVAALVKVQKENQEKKQQQGNQQPGGGETGDQPLVDKLAELRLVRTLQMRINNRTDALSKMLAQPDDAVGQAQADDILSSIRELAARQEKIGKVTRTIVESQ